MPQQFTQSEIEQYYRVRLDPYKLHHSKGLWYRSLCPLHGGDNPNSLSVNFENGGFHCFSCQAKGGSIFSFEQDILRRSNAAGQAPESGAVDQAIHEVIGTPFVQRVYTRPFTETPWGWDRANAQDYYRYTDELGNELFTVWRFVDAKGNKITPPDHPCPCRKNTDAECEEGCKNGRVWGFKGCRRVLYRLPDVLQSVLVFIVEGEKNANDLSRALALFISNQKGFPLGSLILDRVGVTTNPGGSSGWKDEYEYGKYFTGKIVVKLEDNDVPGKMHTQSVCSEIAKYAMQLFTLDLPVGEGEDISDYLKNHDIKEFIELLANRKVWEVTKPKIHILPKNEKERIILVPPSKLVDKDAAQGGDWLVENFIERGTRGLVISPPKTGKSQPLDSRLATPDGWTTMGSIKIGDYVIGSDGAPTRVIAIHPQGTIPIFRVVMCDDSEVRASADHLWVVQTHDDREIGKWRVQTTAQIMDDIECGLNRKHYLPMVSPVQHEESVLDIKPYALGAMLGDGTFRLLNTIGFASADYDIAERVGSECDGFSSSVKHQFYIKLKFAKKRLTRLGLWGKYSYEKHIPDVYMSGSVAQRWQILQGLLDTDGGIESGRIITFSSASSRLAYDVKELVESFGGTARLGSKLSNYKKDGVRVNCRISYRLTIKLSRSLGSPFWCKRKRDQWEKSNIGKKKIPTRKIVNVIPDGVAECQCITIEAKDSLYVTDHHILTHNSILFLDMAVCLGCESSFLGARLYHRAVKTAIISREDGPELVHRRLNQLARGRNISPSLLDRNILVNTEKQSVSFHIDIQKDLDEMAGWLKAAGVEFTIIDVLNRLHLGKENSSDDMTKVMLKFDELGTKSGSQICVIHHTAHAGNARGSTAISGWPDYICKLEQDPTDESIKTLLLRTKSTGVVLPRTIKYWQSDDKTTSRIMLLAKAADVPVTAAEYKAQWHDDD